jgi:molybdopterin-biosynthesis enzyme MoeA-like protein
MGIGVLVIGDEILTGKRADKHLAHAIETLGKRGLDIDFAHYLGDDRGRLTAVLKDTFARNELVFSFGGIGATPDDCTRQAAAAALGVALVPHPDAVREIEAKFGAEAYPHRVLMAEFPAGSRIIPNPFNRVAAFAIRNHHFFPGFPQMAWPMLDWVLDVVRRPVRPPSARDRVFGAGESQLPLMNDCVAVSACQALQLPSFQTTAARLRLGVRGDGAGGHRAGVPARGDRWRLPVRAVAAARLKSTCRR